MYHDREWYWSAADVTYPIVAVKVVRQEFRERHKNTWTGTHTTQGRLGRIQGVIRDTGEVGEGRSAPTGRRHA